MKPDNALTLAYLEKHPENAARVLENLPYTITASLLDELTPEKYIDAFQYLIPSYASNILGTLKEENKINLVNALPVEKLSMLLLFYDDSLRKAILALLAPDKRKDVVRQLQYPMNSVGTIMSPPTFSLPNDISCAEGLKRIKNSKRKYSSEVFVLDRSLHYVGVVTLDKLIKSPGSKKLSSIVDTSVMALSTRKSLHNLSEDPAWLSVRMLPVTDSRGLLKGVLEYTVLQNHLKMEIPETMQKQIPSTSPLEFFFHSLAILTEGLLLKLFHFGKHEASRGRNHDNIT